MKIKVRDDGWMMLPAAVRRRMGVTTGDELWCEETAEGLVLRGSLQASSLSSDVAEAEPSAEEPLSPAPSDAPTAKPVARAKSKRRAPIIAKAPRKRKDA